MPNAASSGGEFWQFSTGVYGADGVARQLLDWQDKRGANVNILLLCLWAATRGRLLTPADFGRAAAAIAGWHTASVEPLRSLRRRLKADWAALAHDAEATRQAILRAELEAERAEQALLVETLAPWPPGSGNLSPDLAAANLAAYFGDADDASAIADLLGRIG